MRRILPSGVFKTWVSIGSTQLSPHSALLAVELKQNTLWAIIARDLWSLFGLSWPAKLARARQHAYAYDCAFSFASRWTAMVLGALGSEPLGAL